MFQIATIGKCVGLKGELKLHLLTDFPKQFKKDKEFDSDNLKLKIEYFDDYRGVVKFVGYDDRTSAERLTNRKLYSNEESTRKNCKLQKDEYFYFDVVGSSIVDDGKVLGIVEDIQEIAGIHYFSIKTSQEYIDKKMASIFMLPYIDRYVSQVDVNSKIITTINAIDILEAS